MRAGRGPVSQEGKVIREGYQASHRHEQLQLACWDTWNRR